MLRIVDGPFSQPPLCGINSVVVNASSWCYRRNDCCAGARGGYPLSVEAAQRGAADGERRVKHRRWLRPYKLARIVLTAGGVIELLISARHCASRDDVWQYEKKYNRKKKYQARRDDVIITELACFQRFKIAKCLPYPEPVRKVDYDIGK